MEKYIVRKGVLSAALVLVTSFVCGIIAIAGFLLGDFQAVLYSAVLEMCVAVVTHTIHQYLRIMIDEEYKENIEYILSTILPKLQEIQKKVLKNQSRLSLDVSVSNKNGEGYISCFACVMNDMGEITDTCFPRFICVCSKEEIDERLNELKEFIKKYIA